MTLSGAELARIRQHVAAVFPHEACGLILARADARRFLEARNVQDLVRAFNPEEEPPATEAYTVDPTTLLEAGALGLRGWRVAAIYHSHTNGRLELSERDRAAALRDGAPLYPGTIYLVAALGAALSGDKLRIAAWVWQAGAFRPEPLTVTDGAENVDTAEGGALA